MMDLNSQRCDIYKSIDQPLDQVLTYMCKAHLSLFSFLILNLVTTIVSLRAVMNCVNKGLFFRARINNRHATHRYSLVISHFYDRI